MGEYFAAGLCSKGADQRRAFEPRQAFLLNVALVEVAALTLESVVGKQLEGFVVPVSLCSAAAGTEEMRWLKGISTSASG